MAEPAESPLPLPGSLDQFVSGSHNFVVYSHGVRTRMMIAMLFVFYLIFFTLFLSSILSHFRELEKLPAVFATSEANLWLGYLAGGMSTAIALAFLLYFAWAVIDIWGLQVCLSPVELRIENTISLHRLPRLMGVGRLPMQEIETLRGGRFLTYVSGKHVTLRFSPVENVDSLIAAILSHAPEAKVIDSEK